MGDSRGCIRDAPMAMDFGYLPSPMVQLNDVDVFGNILDNVVGVGDGNNMIGVITDIIGDVMDIVATADDENDDDGGNSDNNENNNVVSNTTGNTLPKNESMFADYTQCTSLNEQITFAVRSLIRSLPRYDFEIGDTANRLEFSYDIIAKEITVLANFPENRRSLRFQRVRLTLVSHVNSIKAVLTNLMLSYADHITCRTWNKVVGLLCDASYLISSYLKESNKFDNSVLKMSSDMFFYTGCVDDRDNQDNKDEDHDEIFEEDYNRAYDDFKDNPTAIIRAILSRNAEFVRTAIRYLRMD